LVADSFPIAVCWSAKSGCTTALKWFLHQNGLLGEARAYSEWVHDYREQKLMALQGYPALCERVLESPDTFVTKVIRDPTKRAVSSFLHFLRWHANPGWKFTPAAVSDWLTTQGKRLEDGITFRQFMQYLADSKRLGKTVDVHFQQQFDPAQDSRVDQYIPIEQIGESLAALEKRFSLRHSDIHAFSHSSHHNAPSSRHRWPEQAADFPAGSKTLEDLGTPPAEVFLDRQTLRLIAEVFEDDYRYYSDFYTLPRASCLWRIFCPSARLLSSVVPSFLRRAA